MFLTAHRVRSPDGRQGINAFFYLHGDSPAPGMAWDSPNLNVEMIAEKYPGKFVDQEVAIVPGGNSVLSYLDIVAPDGERLARVREALQELEGHLGTGVPVKRALGLMGIRFGYCFGLLPQQVLEEFRQLSGKALTLFSRASAASVR